MPKLQNHKGPLKQQLTFGQRVADKVTGFAGSWTFIIIFAAVFVFWIVLNTLLLLEVVDPFPFILLNLALSTLAAIQAPLILMSQNRQAERDRINARYDYLVNRKAEREVANIQRDLEEIKFFVRNSEITPPSKDFRDYQKFKYYQQELTRLQKNRKPVSAALKLPEVALRRAAFQVKNKKPSRTLLRLREKYLKENIK